MKELIKSFIYKTGLLGLFHYFRNKRVLTVVLFHRVLPDDHKLWASADKDNTVSVTFFKECLRFFKNHYNVIGMDELRQFRNGHKLPNKPLLISFDDGWVDTFRIAFPLLDKEGLPSALFVTTDAIGRPVLSWQEALQMLDKQELIERQDMEAIEKDILVSSLAEIYEVTGLLSLMRKLTTLVHDRRGDVYRTVEALYVRKKQPVLMAGKKKVIEFDKNNHEIGAHGHVHESLVRLDDGREQIKKSLEALKLLRPDKSCDLMSFPHSKYLKPHIQAANKCGFKFLFGGSNCLNPLPAILSEDQVIKRMNMDESELVDEHGGFSRELASWSLFRAPLDSSKEGKNI